MAHPLDVMLRKHVAPVMAEAGFVRTGRVYRLTADSGDSVVLDIRAYAFGQQVVAFWVTMGLITTPYADWICRNQTTPDERPPGMECAFIHAQIEPPDDLWQGVLPQRVPSLWVFDRSVGGDVCGGALAQMLTVKWVPLLVSLLDRGRLLAEIHSRTPGLAHFQHQRERRELLHLVDDGPLSEIERLIPMVVELSPEDNFKQWIRARLARRLEAGG